MNLFLSVSSLAPAYGGPARSVSRLALALAERGLRVSLWSPDGSALSSPLVPRHGNLSPLAGPLRKCLASSCPDLIHDNGIWLRHNHQLAAWARSGRVPRVVSLRGMVEPWAMQHKRWKKRLAWTAYQKRDLATADLHHVTSEAEARHLGRFGWTVPVIFLPNGVDLPDISRDAGSRRRENTVLFVGRIYPVKGLPLLVEAWARVRPAGWQLRIVGPDEGGHRRTVEAEVRRHGLEREVEFTGPLEGSELEAAYESAGLLVLPSHTENFGMAAAEALAHGCPVIATHGTPWRILEEKGCGWWVPTTAEGIAAALAEATNLPEATRLDMGARGRATVAARFSWNSIAEGFIEAYRQVRKS